MLYKKDSAKALKMQKYPSTRTKWKPLEYAVKDLNIWIDIIWKPQQYAGKDLNIWIEIICLFIFPHPAMKMQ